MHLDFCQTLNFCENFWTKFFLILLMHDNFLRLNFMHFTVFFFLELFFEVFETCNFQVIFHFNISMFWKILFPKARRLQPAARSLKF